MFLSYLRIIPSFDSKSLQRLPNIVHKAYDDSWFSSGIFCCQEVSQIAPKAVLQPLSFWFPRALEGGVNRKVQLREENMKIKFGWKTFCAEFPAGSGAWCPWWGRRLSSVLDLVTVSCSRFPFREAQLIHNPDNPLLVTESWLYLVTFCTSSAISCILKFNFPTRPEVRGTKISQTSHTNGKDKIC